MFQRILVPLDGSELAEQALPVAARLARATGGTVILVRVDMTPVQMVWYSGQAATLIQETTEKEHKKVVDYLTHLLSSEVLDGVATKIFSLEGDAAHGILEAAREQQADLIVISSHGRSGLSRWLIGSVAQKVARHSPVPVLVLRQSGEQKVVGLRASGKQAVRVMVPLDGSSLAEAALSPAIALSRALSAPMMGALQLVQVLPILPTEINLETTDHLAAERAQMLDEANAYLTRIEYTLRKEEKIAGDFQVKMLVTADADIAGTLIELAENQNKGMLASDTPNSCAVIAMATHGRNGPAHWIMGSVTERVLHMTKLPLLIVRAANKEQQ